MANDMMRVGGIWANKDKNGKTYLTGKLSPTIRILIFKNEFRETENQPTHILYFAPVEQQEGGGQGGDDDFGIDGDDMPEVAPRAAAPAPRAAAPAPAPRPAAPAQRQAPRPMPARRSMPQPTDDDLQDPFAE